MDTRSEVVLIPGLACNRMMWEEQIRDLADVARCWVAPLPPHDDLGRIAESILEMAPPRFALGGFSMGGYVAFEILARAPERVDRLCLMSTVATPEPAELSKRRRLMIEATRRIGYLPMWRQAVRRLVGESRRGDEAFIDRLMEQGFETGPYAFEAHQIAMMNRPDYRPIARRLRIPTLVVAGREDIATTVEDQRDLAATISGADFAVIEQAGHLFSFERPAETAAVMRQWLIGQSVALAA
jgi:pimeloyl-ACP methyl ester carboxylesterase